MTAAPGTHNTSTSLMHKRAISAFNAQAHEEDQRGSARRYVSIAAAVAAVGGLLFGYDTGIIASALIL